MSLGKTSRFVWLNSSLISPTLKVRSKSIKNSVNKWNLLFSVCIPCFFYSKKQQPKKTNPNPSKRHLHQWNPWTDPWTDRQFETNGNFSQPEPHRSKAWYYRFWERQPFRNRCWFKQHPGPGWFIWLRFFGWPYQWRAKRYAQFPRCLSRKNREKNKTWTETIDAYRFEGWYFGWCFQPKWKM